MSLIHRLKGLERREEKETVKRTQREFIHYAERKFLQRSSPNVAGHPLRSATDRRLGRPLPHQLTNQTRVHLIPPEFLPLHHAVLWSYAVLAVISNCYPPV